jgi:PTS system nitrogen regulatory IIA component
MKIGDLIAPDRVVLDLEVQDKAELLAALAERAAQATGLAAENIRERLAAREAFGSTGIGQGIAIPHASVDGIERAFGLFARLQEPIEFRSIDGEPVDLVFLLLTPAGSAQNVSSLAAITRRLRDGAVLQRLRTQEARSVVYDLLVQTP